MALNKYMHPRNTYKSRKPDFKALSAKYDFFKEKVTVNASGKVILDFKDPAALRALTRALLEDDFGLVVTMPLDRLIPTVPQRLNYILWLEDIIGKENGAKGIDIGTGSSCIYPLLGCRLNQWQFVASEIDDQNMYFATKNVANNKMEDKISIKKVTEETLLIGLIDDNEKYDFSMCNPPFYSDHLEAQGITSSRNDDRSESSSMSTASEAESIAWGGEVRFVTQMIEESLVLQKKVRVYTSLLGKKTSLPLLKDVLQKKKVPKFASTEFCQGRTMRWGIAWTFDETVEFPKSSFKEQKNVKPPLQLEVPRSSAEVVGDYTVPAHTWFIIKQLEELKVHFYTKHSGKFYSCFIIQAKENTWSHQRRKRRQQNKLQDKAISNEQKQTDESDKMDTSQSKNEPCGSVADSNDQENKSVNLEQEVVTEEKKEDSASEVVETKGNKRTASDQDTEHNSKKIKLGEDSSQSKGEVNDKVDAGERTGKECGTDNTVKDGNGIVSENEPTNSVKDRSDSSTVETEGRTPGLVLDVGGTTVAKEGETGDSVVDRSGDQSEKESKTGDTGENPNKSPNTLVRKDVIAQFWKEKMANSGNRTGKKAEKSFYETLEPFNEEEECLLLSKIVLRKEEGVISLSLTYMSGNREAMHQIMQYFKNKLCV